MNVNLYVIKEYENKPRLPAPGKQTQSNPISKAKKMLLHLTINGRRKSFGYYADEIEAAKAGASSHGFIERNKLIKG